MSHSCAPNCAHSVFPNKTLALQVEVNDVDDDDDDVGRGDSAAAAAADDDDDD